MDFIDIVIDYRKCLELLNEKASEGILPLEDLKFCSKWCLKQFSKRLKNCK